MKLRNGKIVEVPLGLQEKSRRSPKPEKPIRIDMSIMKPKPASLAFIFAPTMEERIKILENKMSQYEHHIGSPPSPVFRFPSTMEERIKILENKMPQYENHINTLNQLIAGRM